MCPGASFAALQQRIPGPRPVSNTVDFKSRKDHGGAFHRPTAHGSSSIGVKVSRPQRKKAQGMIRKMEPWQTMDRQPGDTAVCQGWA